MASVRQERIRARMVAARDINITAAPPVLNPGIAALVKLCLDEIEKDAVTASFFKDLAFFSERRGSRSLSDKFNDAKAGPVRYETAIWEKECFEKFFETLARHSTGQKILVAAFRHAYSVYREKILPDINEISFDDQQDIFEAEVVLYLSHNLTGLPYFYGRAEAIGLIYYLADNCFIEYARV